jgi:hypothetical protein
LKECNEHPWETEDDEESNEEDDEGGKVNNVDD